MTPPLAVACGTPAPEDDMRLNPNDDGTVHCFQPFLGAAPPITGAAPPITTHYGKHASA